MITFNIRRDCGLFYLMSNNRMSEEKVAVEESGEEDGAEHVQTKLLVLAHLAGLHGPPDGVEALGAHDHNYEHGQVGHEVDAERDELAADARQQRHAERKVGLREEPVGAAAHHQHARVDEAQNGHVLARGGVAPHAPHHQKRQRVQKRAHYDQNGQHVRSHVIEWLVSHFFSCLCVDAFLFWLIFEIHAKKSSLCMAGEFSYN
jgi:hypothetical protein